MKLVVAEKPAMARDLARVLGARGRGEGFLEGPDWLVTWCIGHLVALVPPEDYDARWKRWSFDTLPLLPEVFRHRPERRTRAQWTVVAGLLKNRQFSAVVNACDAGREGELIFRSVYQTAGSRLPIERLWISSLTDGAIREGFSRLEPGERYEPLFRAARCRSEADWLVGLNATRAMTLSARARMDDALYSIGRVQTPTLALITAREDEIEAFVPQDYFVLQAKAERGFTAKWASPDGRPRIAERALADALVARCSGHPLVVEARDEKQQIERAPELFDLTALQRAANVRFGFSAERTLELAQALYERHKKITYPRTASRVLGEDQRGEIPRVVAALAGHDRLGAHAAAWLAAPHPIGRRVIDGARVEEHHAIIPTGTGDANRLSGDEARLFELIARRFLAALYPDAVLAITELRLRVDSGGADSSAAPGSDVAPSGGKARGRFRIDERAEGLVDELPPPPDRFYARGRVVREPGFFVVEPPRTPEALLPALELAERLPATYAADARRTEPPRRHGDASLLAAMETAGRTIADPELRAAMRDAGLGTPATRAAIIETLIEREYVLRREKTLVPTPKGRTLIRDLPVRTLASAELTGEWEARLSRIARNVEPAEPFMAEVRGFVTEVVRLIAGGASAPVEALALGRCPKCGGAVEARKSGARCASCEFAVPRFFAGRRISGREIQTLLERGKTPLLSGFRSQKGKRFAARLILEAGALALSFPDRGRRGRAVAEGASTPATNKRRPRAADPARPGARKAHAKRGAANPAARFEPSETAEPSVMAKPKAARRRRDAGPNGRSATRPARSESAAPQTPVPRRTPRDPDTRSEPLQTPDAALERLRRVRGELPPLSAVRASDVVPPTHSPKRPRATVPVSSSEATASPRPSSSEATASPRPSSSEASASLRPASGGRGVSAEMLAALNCPKCGQLGLVRGQRAFGCAHWRSGCSFVVAFAPFGVALSRTELEDLIRRGRTRPRKRAERRTRLVLEQGELRLEDAAPPDA